MSVLLPLCFMNPSLPLVCFSCWSPPGICVEDKLLLNGVPYNNMSDIYRSVLLAWIRRSFPSLWVKKEFCVSGQKSEKLTENDVNIVRIIQEVEFMAKRSQAMPTFLRLCGALWKDQSSHSSSSLPEKQGRGKFTWANAGISYSIRSNMMFLGAWECVSHAQPRPQTVFE